MNLKSPVTARFMQDDDPYGSYKANSPWHLWPLERAFAMDVGFQNPLEGTGQYNYPYGQKAYEETGFTSPAGNEVTRYLPYPVYDGEYETAGGYERIVD